MPKLSTAPQYCTCRGSGSHGYYCPSPLTPLPKHSQLSGNLLILVCVLPWKCSVFIMTGLICCLTYREEILTIVSMLSVESVFVNPPNKVKRTRVCLLLLVICCLYNIFFPIFFFFVFQNLLFSLLSSLFLN